MSLYRFFKPLTCLPTAEKAGLSACTTEEANKRGKTRRESIQQVSLLKFMQYAAENGNGAEGWSMQVLNAITSRFEEMQLIYVIKT